MAFPEGRASVPLVDVSGATRERPALWGTEKSQEQGSGTHENPCSGLVGLRCTSKASGAQ